MGLSQSREDKPNITKSNLVDRTIKSGQTFFCEATITGQPKPQVEWLFNGEAINKENVKIEEIGDRFVLSIEHATRDESGVYELRAANSSGEDSWPFTVTVLGKPTKPEGILSISHIHKDGCKLKWSKPSDDGGIPVRYYVIEKMNVKNKRWAHVGKTSCTEFVVTNLTAGSQYFFRVFAVNDEGNSDHSQTLEPMIAKNEYELPDKPGPPNILDWDEKSVTLNWEAPKTDGGAAIQVYIIERREKKSNWWEQFAEFPASKMSGVIEGLKEGTQIQFRVLAVNKAGPSQPSEATKMHTVKHRRLKPTIHRTNLEDKLIKAGAIVTYDVSVIGEPPPKVKWMKNNAEVKTETNVRVDSIDYRTMLTITEATRKDSGKWIIMAENEYGKDEAEVEIIVISVPSKPGGLLRVLDITATTCKLSWNKSVDDGGRPIENYIVEKREVSFNKWEVVGWTPELEYFIEELQPHKEYRFRVKAYSSEGESEALETLKPILAKNPYDAPSKPRALKVEDWDKDHADLIWEAPETDGGAPITKYVIERRENSETWNECTETFECKTRIWQLAELGQYQFRVFAVNKAGKSKASEASEIIVAKPRQLAPQINKENLKPVTVHAGKTLKLEIEAIGDPLPFITWTFLGNKLENTKNIVFTEAKNYSKMSINNIERNQTGKYIVEAVNKCGIDEAEVDVTVIDKPGKPEGPLEVSNVHKEGCRLTWMSPKDDGGLPIEGYVIKKMDEACGLWLPAGHTDKNEIELVNLEPGKKYHYKVKAVNSEGASEYLITDKSTLMKNPFDEPGPPENLSIIDYDFNFVKLKWEKPLNDGGAEIIKFIVKIKDKHDVWKDGFEISGNVTEGVCDGLEEGERYEFCVLAVNKAGVGQPSEPTKQFTAKHKHLKPQINCSNLQNVIVKAGQIVKFDVNVQGEPPPTIKWSFQDKEITSKDFTITNIDYNSKLSILRALRKFSGTYTIKASNDSGEDIATVNILVLSKPSRPLAPLEVFDVCKEGCKLRWNKPEDDGGLSIDHYEIELMDIEDMFWTLACTSKEPNVEIINFKPGKSYKIRVKATNKEGESEALQSDDVVLAKDPFDEPSQPGQPEIIDWDEHHVVIQWQPPTNDGGAQIEKYVLEKKEHGTQSWVKAAEIPGTEICGSIAGLQECYQYQFGVIAVNKAGPSEPSKPSRQFLAKPRYLSPKIDRQNLNNATLTVGQTLVFTAGVKGEPPPELKWTFRGEEIKLEKGMKVVTEDYFTSFELKEVSRHDTGSYTITAKNSSGIDQVNIDVTILSKPTSPVGPLTISDVTIESCKLNWEKPEDDGGDPITHYAVEKLDIEADNWTPVGDSETSEIKVVGLQQGKKYQFRVKAINLHGTSNPLLSEEPILAKNPFVEPDKPGAPVIKDWDSDHAEIEWTTPLSDGGAPITNFIVEKMDKLNRKWQKAAVIIGEKCDTVVTDLMAGLEYQFRVVAVNKGGKSEPSDASCAVVAKPRYMKPFIDTSQMRDITIRAGQSFQLSVNVSGEPIPALSWIFKHEILKDSNTISIVQNDYCTTLVIKNATRSMSGAYVLMAENKAGRDDADVLVIVLDKPGKCKGPLKVSDIYQYGCKLEWKKPADDGGMPIEYYIVETLNKETNEWSCVGTSMETKIEVGNLVPENEYKFRVLAVNAEGNSEVLESEKSIIAKNPFASPKIDCNNLKSIKTNVGKDFTIDLKVSGEPPPTITWELNNKALDSYPNIHITNEPNRTKLYNEYAHRKASGTYIVTATNNYGRDEVKVEVIILSTPSQPKGPLEVFDITKHSCKLRWRVPKDDGGVPIEYYDVDILDLENGSWHHIDRTNDFEVVVDGLTRNKRYKFRVTAVNAEGNSKPLETPEAVTAKNLFDEPAKPEALTIQDWGKDFVNLVWTPPKVDGGFSVSSYIIETKENDGSWKAITEVRADQTDVTITDLKEKQLYKFRVFAVNKIGISEPSESSIEVLIKTRNSPPKIDPENLINMSIKIGDEICFDVHIIGEPPPNVTWMHEDIQLFNSEKINIQNEDYKTKLVIKNSERRDSGKYTITADNINGKDVAYVEVSVSDVPSAPQCPLEVFDVSEKGCHLRWMASEDDGGLPIDYYVVEILETGCAHWVRVGDVTSRVTQMKVDGLQSGGEYLFRVKSVNRNGESMPLIACQSVVAKNPIVPPDKPILEISDWSDRHVDLKWLPPEKNGGSPIEKFTIQKKSGLNPKWEEALHVFGFTTKATVLNLIENDEYEFRIIASNKAGDSEPSNPSKPIVAKPRFLAPSLEHDCLKNIKVLIGKPIIFQVPFRGEPPPFVIWTVNNKPISKSSRVNVVVTEVITRLEIAESKITDSGNYSVILNNSSGECIASANVIVIDRPPNPEGPILISKVTKDAATIKWKPAKDLGGSPITHYLVEKMDTKRCTWTTAGTTSRCYKNITKLTHKNEYLFRVKAVNENGDQSDGLETITVTTIKHPCDEPGKPAPPEIVDWGENFANLKWVPPESDGGTSITSYAIQQKVGRSDGWTKCTEVSAYETSKLISNLLKGNKYEFRVIAKNAAGWSEPSESSIAIIAKINKLHPKITKMSQDITVQTGETMVLEVTFIGDPLPEAVWSYNDKEITSNTRTTVTVQENCTKVCTTNAQRCDKGIYKLELQNEYGTEEAIINVAVLGKPSAPEGPLEESDISKNSVQLTWRPPKDDGGSNLTAYIIDVMDCVFANCDWESGIAYINPQLTHATISELWEGVSYVFRVSAENTQGVSEPLILETAVRVTNSLGVPTKPFWVTAIDTCRDYITIKWNQFPHYNPASDYYLQRRSISENTWVQINKSSVKSCEFTDKTIVNQETYQYRVISINNVGCSDPSDASLPIDVTAIKKKPKLYLDGTQTKSHMINVGDPITLNVLMFGMPIPAVEWYKNEKLLRSSNRLKITTEENSTILHVVVSNCNDGGIYTVKTHNAYGWDSINLRVVVLNKPNPPKGPLRYLNVTSQSILLQWELPEDTGGVELSGYTIEKFEFDKWICIENSCPTTNFTVTGLEEFRQYKFRVSAENVTGISKPLEGDLVIAKYLFDTPDEPGQPSVVVYDLASVMLQWCPPQNDGGRTIIGYIVEERKRDEDWVKVNMNPVRNTQFMVSGLIPGKFYEFRVVAINDAGPGKPSLPSQSVGGKEIEFPPVAPEAPEIDSITSDSVIISWSDDSNSYLVEKKMKDAIGWDPVNGKPTSNLFYTVKDLVEGESYQFRVVAVNEAGESDPSGPSVSVVLEDHPDKPRVTSEGQHITANAGEDVLIDALYVGLPLTFAEWTKNRTEITNECSAIKIQVTDINVGLKIENVSKKDSGIYKLVIRNEYGFDSTMYKLTVLDRPDPPENLLVQDIQSESVTLRWTSPKEDHNCSVTNYVVEKKNIDSDLWCEVANYCSENQIRIHNLSVGKEYEFRVIAENQFGLSDPLVTSAPIKTKYPFEVPGIPGTPYSIETSEDSITLTWTKPESDGGSPVIDYNIDMRTIGEEKTSQIFSTPNTCLIHCVTNLSGYHTYQFRVRAINIIGPGLWSGYSKEILPYTPACPPKIINSYLFTNDIIARTGQELNISISYIGIPQPDVTWSFKENVITENTDNRIRLLNHDSTATLSNKLPEREDTGMYSVCLKNSKGSDTISFNVVILDKPSAPGDGYLDVKDITKDGCCLFWTPPWDDGGCEITNYVIEKLDPELQSWIEINNCVRTCEYDVLDLEEDKYYSFRIRAENQLGQSEPLQKAWKPIKTIKTPDPPIGLAVTDWTENSVNLSWTPRENDGNCIIQGYQLEYRESREENWHQGNKHLLHEPNYTLEDLILGHEYEFRIRAKYCGGLSEASDLVRFKLQSRSGLPTPPAMPETLQIGLNFVHLKWNPPTTDGGSQIIGYNVEMCEEGNISWVKTNENIIPSCDYVVADLIEHGTYEFRIIAVNGKGKSEPSLSTMSIETGEVLGGQKPEFTRLLQTKHCILKENVVFECEAKGDPLPNARWFRQAIPLTSGEGIEISENNGVFTLALSDVIEKDETEYTCHACNAFGSDVTSSRLIISTPPRIDRIPTNLKLQKDENVKIKLCISGSEPLNFTIMKDNQTVDTSERFKFYFYDDQIIIYIQEIKETDAGIYKINLQNYVSKVEATFSIAVIGIPESPFGPITFQEVSNHSVKLLWKQPESDGGSKITHYVIESKDSLLDQWDVSTNICRETTCVVQGLRDNRKYLFRVSAVNYCGRSLPLEMSDYVTTRLPFDPPESPGIPKIKKIGGGYVDLEWDKKHSDNETPVKGYFVEQRELRLKSWQRVNHAICKKMKLHISNLMSDWEYVFRVFAVNDAGLSEPSGESNSVKIIDPCVAQPPEFYQEVTILKVAERCVAELGCGVVGNPAPKITWWKGQEKLVQENKYQTLKTGDYHTLIIKDFKKKDTGEYLCRAENWKGVKTSKAELKITGIKLE